MTNDKVKNGGKAENVVKNRKGSKNVKKDSYQQPPVVEGAVSTVEEGIDIAYTASKRPLSTGINNWVILQGVSKKPESRMTSFEKIDIIKEGISKKDLEHLKEITDLDYNQLSKVLSVARATLINKKGNARFDAVLSERIVGVADIYSYGYEVFEDENRFNAWIFRANRALGGQAPYDLLDNQYGREEVKNLIGRIAYGVYS